MNRQVFLQALQKVRLNMQSVMVGKEGAVNLLLVALLCNGHVLLEDVPGIGKTTLVNALAQSLDCTFARIQFTPDITPSDITGFSLYNMKTQEFEFRPGPILNQIILADEINRTSPKTQSSLLEIMQEQQVTVDGVSYPLPSPFMVLATQNPLEYAGTYPLPEAQLDRFCLSVRMGYPTVDQEIAILARAEHFPQNKALEPVLHAKDITALQKAASEIYCAETIKLYIAKIADTSRNSPELKLGISPRASIHLMQAAKAIAFMEGRDYVVPGDVRQMCQPVLAHRLILRAESKAAGNNADTVLNEILRGISVPR